MKRIAVGVEIEALPGSKWRLAAVYEGVEVATIVEGPPPNSHDWVAEFDDYGSHKLVGRIGPRGGEPELIITHQSTGAGFGGRRGRGGESSGDREPRTPAPLSDEDGVALPMPTDDDARSS